MITKKPVEIDLSDLAFYEDFTDASPLVAVDSPVTLPVDQVARFLCLMFEGKKKTPNFGYSWGCDCWRYAAALDAHLWLIGCLGLDLDRFCLQQDGM